MIVPILILIILIQACRHHRTARERDLILRRLEEMGE